MNFAKRISKFIFSILILILLVIAVHWAMCAICVSPAVSTDGNWKSYILKGYYNIGRDYDSHTGLLYYSGSDPLPSRFSVVIKGVESGYEEPVTIDTVANPKTWKLTRMESFLLLRDQENAYLYLDGYGTRAPEEDLIITIWWTDSTGKTQTTEIPVYKKEMTANDYVMNDRFYPF